MLLTYIGLHLNRCWYCGGKENPRILADIPNKSILLISIKAQLYVQRYVQPQLYVEDRHFKFEIVFSVCLGLRVRPTQCNPQRVHRETKQAAVPILAQGLWIE